MKPPALPHPGPRADQPEGFVLIGVVTLILALTILGLSLFTLSSYESQFIGDSINRLQALESAQGGIERTKYLLAAFGRLDSAGAGLPFENVVGVDVFQMQNGDTARNGPIEWNGENVHMTVTAEYEGVRRALTAQFNPRKPESYYGQTITVADSIQVNTTASGAEGVPLLRMGTIVAPYGFWQVSPDTSWTDSVDISIPPGGVVVRQVPTPVVAPFIAAHAAGATVNPVTAVPGAPSVYQLDLVGTHVGPPRYYHTTEPSLDMSPTFTYFKDNTLLIRVAGRVVWMLDHGFKTDYLVTVEPLTSDASLVMVAGIGRDTYWENGAIWFWGGLNSWDVPIILVTDGRILLEQNNSSATATTISNLSMFATDVFLTGPRSDYSVTMRLFHDPLVMKPLVDSLTVYGALPNATAGTVFALRPGTWQETPP